MAERFTTMAQVHAERQRLKALRDARGEALGQHWNSLGAPAIRQALVGGAVKGMLRGLFTWRTARDAATGAGPGIVGGILGAAVGGPGASAWRRAVGAGLGALVPLLWERFRSEGGSSHVLSEFGRSWRRVKDYLRERRAAHRSGTV